MAESDGETKMDEMERDALQKAISDVERATANAAPGSKPFFEVFLLNAKGRVNALDKKIKDAQVERETHAREAVVMAQMVQQETALSAQEKETFGGFLKKDFFTKNDFGSLEQFYAKTWDRLTEQGKDAMSHRVWEGVRRSEYTFGELPKTVREKETEHAYKRLHEATIGSAEEGRIPLKDREDFMRAYEAGKKEEAGKILDRESFKQHMFRGGETKGFKQTHAEAGRGADRDSVERIAAKTAPPDSARPAEKAENKSGLDLSSFDLGGAQLTEAPAEVSSADVKAATAAATRNGASFRGC